ncbi:hypothetical protein BVC71_04575 [Marivivens niveibacter]|uniref:Outer membrane protein assembly factor BamE domain-containing protein n=1 Tax=Marivivens niveibacter TaxID=1930667 RepID=A0A251X3M8_9RHOB|nr:outer membrane protein assembly factor BamE [Marivivens niveibacter]OUD10763.1 hypothetical protein BVC71_04575 [Marivivens niveibacter]
MFKFQPNNRSKAFLAAVCASAFLVSGCVERIDRHGYTPEVSQIETVNLGSDRRDDVIAKLGQPTTGGVLDQGGLYYISYGMRHYGALAPKELDRKVVAVTFDGNGVARNVETFGVEQGRVVSLSRRVTDDNLRDTTLLRQLLSSIGNFDPTSVFGDG